ncbi:MAG: nitrile hydratase beta subunit [Paracoccaceae bacterium]|jgi:nitrile hydratase beta subunit
MNGPHDLGGRAGFGPVIVEIDEPVFHAEWEKRALGLTLCAGVLGYWPLDAGRFARESLAPAVYYSSSYYEIWFRALEALLIRHGEVTAQEVAVGQMLQPGLRADRCMSADKVFDVLSKGGPVNRTATGTPRFKVGDAVRTTATLASGHTRLPGYARDKAGIVTAMHGAHVFPDSNAHGLGEAPHWLYTVEFDGETLWGARAEPATTMRIDAWEAYLVPS